TIKENLSIALPDYMIPSAIVRLENMPITINGKIDKKALPTPQVEGSKNGKYEGPRNEIEEKLIELWEDILGVKRISINDSFFELGGHSLRASILVKQIYMCFKKTIPLRTIFLMPTIKQIAQVLSTMHNDDIEIIDIAHKKDYYPLSSAQKRLYTLQQLEEGTTSYNIPNIVEIQGTIEEECLQNAFKKLLDRHETLRTSFEIVNDEPVQMIHDEIDACVEVIEIEEKDIQETIKSLIKPFELNKAPLIRVTLIKVSDGKSLLMYDIHHIISDGISMKILVEEFMKLYSKKELPQLTRQYKDYSEWQNKLIESKEFKKEKAYWLDMFSGNIPVLNMSSDYTRPAVKKYDGRDIEVELNIDVVKKLKKLSGDTGTTMYMILMAAFNVLMSKYSNQEDIVVGTPIAGRSHIDLEGIIGMFVNTLAMRNKPESEKTFLEFLNEVKETALQAYENQNYQFEELVNHLEVVRDFSRNPIFDVMFAMQNFEKVEIEEKGLRVTPYNYENSVAKFDLTMTAIERDERIMVSINYCTSLFKEDTIMRMMEHYENILSIVTEDENVQLKDIDMLSTDEKEMVVKAFNDTYVKYNKHRTIQEIFEKQVEESYERTALIYEDQDMTYEELNRRANQLARKLRGYGVTKDSIVGLMVERSFEMIVGIMGILKAGGAYLPIDPEYPQNRIEYMLGNSETRILLTQSWIREKVKYQHKIIELDNEELYEGDSSNPVNINEGRDLAYVIYTSGSTGKPKGVMIEHCNLNNIVTIMQDKYPVKEDGAYLLKTNFTFDVSIVEIFGWILSKGRLVILKQGDEKDINRIINAVNVHKVTHINFVPSMLNVLVNHLDEVNKRSLKHLEYVMVAGEAFSVKLAKEISIILDTNIENIYGPTEATVYSTGYSIKDVHKLESVPIGKALDNVKIHIIDKNLRLKPIGIVGELCISGAGVARGYLNNEQLTRERFIPNPYVSGEIMYKTGDLARWLPDGNIEFCGRADHQVKIRGYRIELGEIESQLLSDKRIEEAVVVSKGETDVDKYLCAYVTTTEEISDNTIKEYLRIVLPNYMIPSVIIRLESMPLTVNGKIDKKALPTPNVEGSKNGEYEGPRNQTEEKLTKLWEDVLGVKKISINDNFFELGGHSLRATVLASKIHKKFSVNIPLSQIFNSPNIKELSEYIVKNEKEVYKSIEIAEKKDNYQLSSAQKRLYTLQQLEVGTTSYNIPNIVEIEGTIEEERLQNAYKKLLTRHETLRTSFIIVNDEPVQMIHDKVEAWVEVIEVEEKDIQETIKALIKPFELNKAPLIRVILIKVAHGKNLLMYDIHHIISDGISMKILVEEFMKFYSGKELPQLTRQYKDYSEWQNKLIETKEFEKEKIYWLNMFKESIPVLNMPSDYVRPEVNKYDGRDIEVELNIDVVKRLKKLSENTGTTMYMILMAAFNVLLSKYSNQEDIVVGTPIAGRAHIDLEGIIGMFVNTLAMRNKPEGEKTFLEFLGEVKGTALQAYENQNYQFEELVDHLEITRDFSRNPIFDVMFAMQNFEKVEIEEKGLRVTPYNYENNISKFDLTMTAIERDERIMISINYCTSLFKEATIIRMMEHYENILSTVTEDENVQLKYIDMLSTDEKEIVVKAFNDTYVEYSRDKTIQDLFEVQSIKYRDRIAVNYDGKILTYSELNNKANYIAKSLVEKGVTHGDIIAINANKSLEMIIGILAVLKAGAAYLPLDFNYPSQRIQFMLDDCGVKLLLSNFDLDMEYEGIE
ncbi:non-ribosomal peptide synthetase, partial [Vallitalea longa]|uniref:non-ribosomal peptide synthetase n=1 Tax=Vallitalea longa TaxID=2936439 RepID=UPI002491458B